MNKYELNLIEPTVATPKKPAAFFLPEICATPSPSLLVPETNISATPPPPSSPTFSTSAFTRVRRHGNRYEGTGFELQGNTTGYIDSNKENSKIVRFHPHWRDERVYQRRKNDEGNLKLPHIR